VSTTATAFDFCERIKIIECSVFFNDQAQIQKPFYFEKPHFNDTITPRRAGLTHLSIGKVA